MSFTIILFVMVFIAIVGGGVAVVWWRMAAAAAPYRDEIKRREARMAKPDSQDEPGVIVIDDRSAKSK